MILILALLTAIASGVGLFMITPMTAGWLVCGIVFGIVAGLVIEAFLFLGMDTYAESIILVARPASWLSYAFAVWCVAVLIWRGLGLHVEVNID